MQKSTKAMPENNNFGTLFYFELKKIFHKKLVWITTAIMLIIIAFTVSSELIGEYWVNGQVVNSNYNEFKTDRAYRRALNGRQVNQELLEQTFGEYAKVPTDNILLPYSATEEYQKYARPYSPVFGLVRQATKMTVDEAFAWQPDEQALYEMWHETLREEWKAQYLSEGEVNYWEARLQKVETPFSFYYSEGYFILIRVLLTIGLMTLMSVSICLADIFPRERIRRTDQLNIAGKNGKRLYRVKLLAGGTLAAGIAFLYSLFAIGLALILYGADGFGAAFQLINSDCAYPMSAGAAILTAYGLLIVIAVFWGIFVMVLSEVCRNNIAALAISSGLLMLSMFVNVPEQYRVLSQIWGFFPGAESLSYWGTFEPRLVPFLGGYLTKWQFAPFLYVILGALFSLFGKPAYGRGK